MGTVANWAQEEIIKENGQYPNVDSEARARRLIERNRRLNQQRTIWENLYSDSA